MLCCCRWIFACADLDGEMTRVRCIMYPAVRRRDPGRLESVLPHCFCESFVYVTFAVYRLALGGIRKGEARWIGVRSWQAEEEP
jgi:hypothetical protein